MPVDSPDICAAPLVYVPTAALVTSTEMVQLARPFGRLPPASEIALPPTGAVTVPLHWVGLGALATTRPAGSVSVKASGCCCGFPAPLAMVKVSVLGVLITAGDVPNALVSVVPTTTSESFTPETLAATSAPAKAEKLALVLLYVPAAFADALMTIVQTALAAMSMLDTRKVALPAASAPPAELVRAGVAPQPPLIETFDCHVTPAGNVSVNAMLLLATAEFAIVNV